MIGSGVSVVISSVVASIAFGVSLTSPNLERLSQVSLGFYQAIDGLGGGFGIEIRPILKLDAGFQVNAPGEIVDLLPTFGEPWRNGALFGLDIGQRFRDVGIDHTPDVGADRATGFKVGRLLGQHDLDFPFGSMGCAGKQDRHQRSRYALCEFHRHCHVSSKIKTSM